MPALQNTNFQEAAGPVDPQQLDTAIPVGVTLLLLGVLPRKAVLCSWCCHSVDGGRLLTLG